MNKIVLGILAGVGGLTLGAAVGHLATKKYLLDQFESLIDNEIELTKAHLEEVYGAKYAELAAAFQEETQEEVVPTPLETETEIYTPDGNFDVAKNLSVELNDDGTEKEPEEPEEDLIPDEAAEDSALREHIESLQYEEEAETAEEVVDEFFQNRDHTQPYVISIEEYMTTEDDFAKVSLSFYEGDETLCDENERVITDVSRVGHDNLHRFGDHSDNKDIVYIRNSVHGVDYEVLREPGKYAVRVLGMPEPRAKKSPGKMRDDED